MMSVKISSKYQVVIPQEVREQLNLKPGTEVNVIAKGGIIYIVPVRSILGVRDQLKKYKTSELVSLRENIREKKDRKV
jgi:AbrB family looped-hinge helix DNA binding protein